MKRVPPELMRPCPPAWSKEGGPAVTGDFVLRGDANEEALFICAAQIEAIRAWDEFQAR